jgi:uncharacterized SAM-binding protein YcdF (DUF218 family)
MNGLLALLGIESWKPVLSALALPPVPFLLLILIGARLILPRRGLGWFVTLLGVAGLWLSACTGAGQLLNNYALKPPAPLSAADVAELKNEARARKPVAIVILGGGADVVAPEYGVSNLRPQSTERLRYGVWLHRETGLPMAFSGGVGWAQRDGQAEAQIAARIAAQDFGRPLKWVEDNSRDTRENAIRTLALLRADGINHIVLVTQGTHMPRAVKVFQEVAAGSVRIQPAPMGLAPANLSNKLAWIPSTEGFDLVRRVLHELAGKATPAPRRRHPSRWCGPTRGWFRRAICWWRPAPSCRPGR